MTRAAGALAALLLVAVPALASSGEVGAATDGARYIVSRQNASGAFFSAEAPADGVAEALAVVAASGIDRAATARALAYIRTNGIERSRERAAYAGRIVLGLLAADADPRDFGGDHVEQVRARYDAVKGTYDQGMYSNALAVIALRAAGEQVPDRVETMFRTNACRDGGFGHQEGCLSGPDTDTTAMALIALARLGVQRDDAMVRDALAWLREVQLADGGFGARAGDPVNANSTGLVISALVAWDIEPDELTDGSDPIRALAALQLPNGGFRYVASDRAANDYATVQATPALAGRTYPVESWKAAARREVRDAGRRPVPPPAAVEREREERPGFVRGAQQRAVSPAVVGATGARKPVPPDPVRAPVAPAAVLLVIVAGLHTWRLWWDLGR